jgi:hypothetical protein
MRFLLTATIAALTLAPVHYALAETAPRPASPEIGETQDAAKKAEYLEARPYKPCPASVRFPNGQNACLGLPGYPDWKVRTDDRDE